MVRRLSKKKIGPPCKRPRRKKSKRNTIIKVSWTRAACSTPCRHFERILFWTRVVGVIMQLHFFAAVFACCRTLAFKLVLLRRCYNVSATDTWTGYGGFEPPRQPFRKIRYAEDRGDTVLKSNICSELDASGLFGACLLDLWAKAALGVLPCPGELPGGASGAADAPHRLQDPMTKPQNQAGRLRPFSRRKSPQAVASVGPAHRPDMPRGPDTEAARISACWRVRYRVPRSQRS